MNSSYLKNNKEVKLTPNDLFDRIINLRVKVGTPATKDSPAIIKDEFVIRSDYEIYYPGSDSVFYKGKNEGKYIIRRCTIKPSIKVQYNMVTGNVGTAIDIYISNFFIFTSDGKYLRNFTMKDYAVLEVEIYMGYWGQFADTLKPDSSLKDYFNIKAYNGADKIVVGSPVIVTTDKLPPDSTLHLKGYVADVLSNPVAITNVTEYSKASLHPSLKSGDDIETLFYNMITRRYLKHNSINVTDNYLVDVVNKLTHKPTVDEETGLLSEEEADEYGVKVFFTEGAKKFKFEKKKDGEGNEIDAQLSFEAGLTIGNTITRLLSFLNADLNYRFNNEGDILVYLDSESDDLDTLSEDFKETYENNTFSTYYDGKLPAVYNINIDGVSSISCPFFSFIEPFQVIKFASRYAITSLVEYAVGYPTGYNEFIVIRASISFATVEPINEVTMSAIVKGTQNEKEFINNLNEAIKEEEENKKGEGNE